MFMSEKIAMPKKREQDRAKWTIRGWFEDAELNTYHFESPVKLLNRRWYDSARPWKVEYLVSTPEGEIWVHSISPPEEVD